MYLYGCYMRMLVLGKQGKSYARAMQGLLTIPAIPVNKARAMQ